MAEVLRLREAARVIGVSPGRLYRAIAAGRLLEALQAFCQSEGLRVPDAAEIPERSEHAERSTPPDDKLALQALETLAVT